MTRRDFLLFFFFKYRPKSSEKTAFNAKMQQQHILFAA